MGLLSPWFLLGALAIGLPLWLHLLRQHRRTPLSFSSVMFFERRMQSSVQQRRLRYLLLLALRIALLLLLALAFAAPFVYRKAAAVTAKQLTVIALDRSFSMRYGNRMEEAKQRALQELSGARGNALVEVLAVDSHVEVLAQPTLDRGTLRAAIASLQPTDLASSFGQLVRALRVREQTTGRWLDVRFISDMQQTSMPRTFQDWKVGPRTELHLISVAQRNAPNWTVETVNAPSQIYDAHDARVRVTVSGWQTSAALKKLVLLMDGKSVASKDLTVPAGGRAQAEFIGFDVSYGSHRAEVQIQPHDELPQDDAFPFALERSDPAKILFLSPSGRVRDALYYRAAMESAPDSGLVVQPTAAEQITEAELAHCAFVVLNDVGSVNGDAEQSLTDYVRKGGSALIALGPRSAGVARVPITGDRFSLSRQTQGIAFVDGQTAAVRNIRDVRNVQFFEAPHLEAKPDAHVLMRLADGSPLLVEERVGSGRVLTFASGLDNVTNDFPLHASFLPFVVQTGRYLAGSEETAHTLVAGSSIDLHTANDNGAAVTIVGPDGKNELPLGEAARVLGFPLNRDGFYEVQRAYRRRELLAVHADRRESDLTPVSEQTLALWRDMGRSSPVPQNGVVEQPVQPWSLWRYLLLAALSAALAESVIANGYLKKGRQPG